MLGGGSHKGKKFKSHKFPVNKILKQASVEECISIEDLMKIRSSTSLYQVVRKVWYKGYFSKAVFNDFPDWISAKKTT